MIDTITDIQAHPFNDDYLLSASKDGSVRMWNILTGKCLLIFEIKASVVVKHKFTYIEGWRCSSMEVPNITDKQLLFITLVLQPKH